MFGKLKSAKTKEEWDAFIKDLNDKEKYIIGIEGFKNYPFGTDIIKTINYMIELDTTFVLDKKGINIDILKKENEKKYANNKKKRLTVFKELLENKDEIKTLNLKYHLITNTWYIIRTLLNFDENNIGTSADKDRFYKYASDSFNAQNLDEKIRIENEYGKYVSKRFFQKYPYLKNNSHAVGTMLNLILQMIIFAKDGKDAEINKLSEGIGLLKVFTGNPIEKRKNDNFNKYKTVITLIKCMETHFKALNGVQKKACEMVEVKPSSFSKWKSENNDKYWKIFNELTEMDLIKYREEIKQRYY